MGLRAPWSDPMDLPATRLQHLGIVVGGHRYWAGKTGVPEGVALAAALSGLLDIVYFCRSRRARRVTVYGFMDDLYPCPSQVNADAAQLTLRFLKSTLTTLDGQNIRVRLVGDMAKLPDAARALAQQAQDCTAANDGMELVLAIDGFQGLAQNGLADGCNPQPLDTPELAIRCGGSLPVNRPMFWDTTQTALYATERLWPELDLQVLKSALQWYRRPDRGNATWVRLQH
jgi:undecaprenyl diphosphate synthase